MRDAARDRSVIQGARKVGLVVVAVAGFLLVADVARIGVEATRGLLERDSIAETYAKLDTQRCVQEKID